ncbi:MAG: fibronectin type III domain-containing protein, partial [Verrucomicrobiota bacterium]
GSFQVHNTDLDGTGPGTAGETIIAYNRWGEGSADDDVGIGNQPTGHPDWTFSQSARAFRIKNLNILVRPRNFSPAATPPNLVVTATNLCTADLAWDAVTNAVFYDIEVNGSRTVTVTLANTLTVSNLIPGTANTFAVRARNFNSTSAWSMVVNAVTPSPVLFANVPEATSLEWVYVLEIEDSASYQNAVSVPYCLDRSSLVTQAFDRVAYVLELNDGGGLQWVYVSMDAFTTNPAHLGLPHHLDVGVHFQQNVSNLNIYAGGGANVTTGTLIQTGNIEFWPNNYGTVNEAGVPGADGGLYDFGDDRIEGVNPGYGCFQVHNHGAGETLLAYNRWTGGGAPSDLGIGNQPTNHPDWTFSANAATWLVKRLFVLVGSSVSDTDGDGVSDDDEAIAGTDPFDSNSFLWVRMSPSTNQVVYTLTFPSVVNRMYSIECTTNLYSGLWTETRTNIPGSGGLLTVPQTNATTVRKYFRIGVTSP